MLTLEFRTDGLKQHASFCVWIVLFDIVTVRFFRIVPCIGAVLAVAA